MVIFYLGGEKALYDEVLRRGFWEGEIKEEERCMKDLNKFLEFFFNNSKRARWDLSFLIRSRGRWGKCG